MWFSLMDIGWGEHEADRRISNLPLPAGRQGTSLPGRAMQTGNIEQGSNVIFMGGLNFSIVSLL